MGVHSQVAGLGDFDPGISGDEPLLMWESLYRVRSLLLTRRPSLAMWERSKLPEGAAEAEVRRKLSRRYDLCDWTVVYTTTLLTATDAEDTARWA